MLNGLDGHEPCLPGPGYPGAGFSGPTTAGSGSGSGMFYSSRHDSLKAQESLAVAHASETLEFRSDGTHPWATLQVSLSSTRRASRHYSGRGSPTLTAATAIINPATLYISSVATTTFSHLGHVASILNCLILHESSDRPNTTARGSEQCLRTGYIPWVVGHTALLPSEADGRYENRQAHTQQLLQVIGQSASAAPHQPCSARSIRISDGRTSSVLLIPLSLQRGPLQACRCGRDTLATQGSLCGAQPRQSRQVLALLFY
jgi:hypothetical protein